MDLEPKKQESLYNDPWYPMEVSFGPAVEHAQFDAFMRDYLAVKTGRIPKIQGVYEAFKSYVQGARAAAIEEIVKDIHHYAKFFVRMALEQESDKELREAFSDINTRKIDVAYPFLLELYANFQSRKLVREDFLRSLRYVESYVFRPTVCGIPTNSRKPVDAEKIVAADRSQWRIRRLLLARRACAINITISSYSYVIVTSETQSRTSLWSRAPSDWKAARSWPLGSSISPSGSRQRTFGVASGNRCTRLVR
jgi:uncharacterized protein with ParB-like and HNH nuclease domain